jgi:hypothetical protein
MKTRLLLMAAVALTFLSAEIARAGTEGDECPKELCPEKQCPKEQCPKKKCSRIRSARAKCHERRECNQSMRRVRRDETACTAGRAHCLAQQHSATETWHGNYYHVMWGEPVALVVPPTAELQTHWNWGVAQTAITPIWHQYNRAYPGPFVAGGQGFRPTPRWPSSTDQFGVYYVRGPW